jgi:hypothetical protein
MVAEQCQHAVGKGQRLGALNAGQPLKRVVHFQDAQISMPRDHERVRTLVEDGTKQIAPRRANDQR